MKIKNEKGITLISLVITIIIMLILAGVVIILALGNNGLIGKAKEAKEETNKQTAIEQINLKITNSIMKKYAIDQREPNLQELADDFCEDEEIEYVELSARKLASIDKVEIGENKSFFTKLKKYPYEFEIGDSLKIVNIDGKKVDSTASINFKNANLEITNISTIGCDAKVKENFEDALYVYVLNDKVQNYGKENSIKIENCKESTQNTIKVIIIENDGSISIAQETFKTKQAEYLYKDGKIYDLAGNFEIGGYVSTSSSHSLNFLENKIRLTENKNQCAAYMKTSNTIDCSKYSKLYVEVEDISTLTNWQRVFMSTATYYKNVDTSGNLNIYEPNSYTKLKKITVLDISSINEEAYLYIRQTHSGHIDINRIWLEK